MNVEENKEDNVVIQKKETRGKSGKKSPKKTANKTAGVIAYTKFP